MRNKIKSISDVINSGLCISCGGCVAACESGSAFMELDEELGQYVPKFSDKWNMENNTDLLAYCPGKGFEINALYKSIYGKDISGDIEFGHFERAIACHTTSAAISERASSGGIMALISSYLLENDYVDGIVGVKFIYGGRGPRTKVFIASTFSEILDSQGSKYCPTDTLSIINECKKKKGTYLFVGTPCQVAGLRLLMKGNDELVQMFPYTMTNFCGGYRGFQYLDGMIEQVGVKPKDAYEFRFRGGGWPGTMKVKSVDSIGEQPYPGFSSKALVTKHKRCVFCIDGTGLLADFSCGDAWIDRFKPGEIGWSILVARSPKANSIMNKLIENKLIVYEDISLAEMQYSQKFNLKSKIWRQKSRMKLHTLLRIKIPVFDYALPDSITTIFDEFIVLLGKTKLILYVRNSFKKTALGKMLVKFKKRKCR